MGKQILSQCFLIYLKQKNIIALQRLQKQMTIMNKNLNFRLEELHGFQVTPNSIEYLYNNLKKRYLKAHLSYTKSVLFLFSSQLLKS